MHGRAGILSLDDRTAPARNSSAEEMKHLDTLGLLHQNDEDFVSGLEQHVDGRTRFAVAPPPQSCAKVSALLGRVG